MVDRSHEENMTEPRDTQDVVVPPVPTAAPANVPPAQAAPPPPVGADPSTPSTANKESHPWFAPFSAGVLLGGLAHVGVTVAASFLGGAALLAVLLMLGDSDVAATSIGSLGDLLNGFGVLAGLLFTLTAAVLGGEITISLGGSAGMFSAAGSASLWVFPLTLTVGVLTAALWWGVRQGRVNPLPTRLHRAVYGLAVGLVTGLVLLFLALIFAVRAAQMGASFEISAAGYRVVLFSTLFVGAAAYIGREAGALAQPGDLWMQSVARLSAAAPRAVREWAVYAAFGTALFAIVGAIQLVVSTWNGAGIASLGLAVIGLLNVAPFAAALGHFGGVSASGTLGGSAASSTQTVFNAGEPALWLAVLAAVLLTGFVALWIGTRRPRTAGIEWRTSWQLPVMVFGSWLVLGPVLFGIGISAAGAAGMFGGALGGGIGIALWSAPVFLIWAVAVELGAQTLPRVAYGTLPRVHRALVGERALAGWVAGTSSNTLIGSSDAGAAVSAPTTGSNAVAQAPSAQQASDDPAAAPLPEPTPLSPAAKRGLIIGLSTVGGLIVLAVVGGIGVGVVNATRSPQAVAQQYLEHIAAGRAEAAGALVDPNIPTDQRAFLTDDVLASASEGISDIEVHRSDVGSGDSAGVAVSYKLDGVTREAYLEARKGEPEWLVLDTWQLTSTLVTPVSFWSSGPGSVAIGGVALDALEGSESQAMLYPGVYELIAQDSTYFELEDPTLVVDAAAPGTKEIVFTPTDALRDEVRSQVDALLAACVAETSADPDGCPFSAYTYNDDTKVTWKLPEQPTIEIGDDGGHVLVEGVATGSYTEEFFGSTREREDEDRFSFYADISVDGDQVEVGFDDTWW